MAEVKTKEKILGASEEMMQEAERMYKHVEPEAPAPGFMTRIKQMMGATSKDQEHRNHRAMVEADDSIVGRFAAEVARRNIGKPMHEITKTLPEVWRSQGLSANRDEAFVQIAEAAGKLAKRHMQGPNGGLAPAFAYEAKARTLASALVFEPKGQNQTWLGTLNRHQAASIDIIKRELSPETAPKPLKPERSMDAENVKTVTPSLGSVVAIQAARAAGMGR